MPKGNLSQHAADTAEKLAASHHFQAVLIPTQPFTLMSFQRLSSPSPHLTIYIEGDGRTWTTRNRLSSDPTPLNPLALKLAILDPAPNVAYLARPCQYTLSLNINSYCQPTVWSDSRFSETVIQSMMQAVDALKKSAGAKKLHLIGFSGGAAIAILVAARRQDVASLTTVAGDLNHEALSAYHHTTPISDSLNPSIVIPRIRHLPQHHFSGEKDSVVPLFIARDFVKAVNQYGSHCASQHIVPGTTHHEGWEKAWKQLLQLPFACGIHLSL